MLKMAHVQLRDKYQGRPLWAFLIALTGCGSTTACEIARECGWDPEQDGGKPLTAVL